MQHDNQNCSVPEIELSQDPLFQRLWADASPLQRNEYLRQRYQVKVLRQEKSWAPATVAYARKRGWIRDSRVLEIKPITDMCWWALRN